MGPQFTVCVPSILLTSKLSHIESVNGIIKSMKNRIRKKIKDFTWGGKKKKARVRWEIMIKYPNAGVKGIEDPISILYAAKTNML